MSKGNTPELHTVAVILAGGRGERLGELTRTRSKPALPFGDGRIIDFTLHNLVRSGLPSPVVITQYQAASLTSHVREWWARHASRDHEPICVPRPAEPYWGTADAIWRNLSRIPPETRNVLVLSADHIYQMDYGPMLAFHEEKAADVTLASIVFPREDSHRFGILDVSADHRVHGFAEKPASPKSIPGSPGLSLVNMGVYLFRRDVLVEALVRNLREGLDSRDLGKDVFPGLVSRRAVYSFRFESRASSTPGYWRDVGTIDSYYEANMEWLRRSARTDVPGTVGCLVFDGASVHPSARVVESVVLPGVEIGAGARVRRAILDEGAAVLRGASVGCPAERTTNLHQTASGITVVPAGAIVRPDAGRRRDRSSSPGRSRGGLRMPAVDVAS